MAHYSKEVKDEVRKKYIYEGLSLASVSVLVDVPYGTVARWKTKAKERGDDWDKVKSAHTLAGGNLEDLGRQLLTEFTLQYQTTFEQLSNELAVPASVKAQLLASLADSFVKTVNANKKLMPETSELAVAMKVMNMLADFVATQTPQHLEFFANDVIIPFGELLEKELK